MNNAQADRAGRSTVLFDRVIVHRALFAYLQHAQRSSYRLLSPGAVNQSVTQPLLPGRLTRACTRPAHKSKARRAGDAPIARLTFSLLPIWEQRIIFPCA